MVRPSGPLPPRVYWFRRLLLLLVVAALLFWLARTVGSTSDPAAASTRPGPASTAAAPAGRPQTPDRPVEPGHPSAGRPTAEEPVARRPRGEGRARDGGSGQRPAKKRTPLAVPDGPCRPDEVALQPVVSANNEAGNPVELRLRLQTTERPACTLTLSPDNLLVKVSSGPDELWTSAQCPAAILPSRLVVRAAAPLTYRVVWSGARSAPRCPLRTADAVPGRYVVAAAVVGGEPAQTRFVLDAPRDRRGAAKMSRGPAGKPGERRPGDQGSRNG